MQPVNSVSTKCGDSNLPYRIFGICPIGEDRRIPLWRRCVHHAAFGGLIGFLVLHPLSMVAHGIFHPGTFRIWQTLGVSFSERSTTHMALPLAERVGAAVSKHRFPLKEAPPGVSVTVSIGLAEFPGNARTMEELIQRSDQALYEAKAKGRNQVCQPAPGKEDHLSACERV